MFLGLDLKDVLLFLKYCFKSNHSERHPETLDRQIIRNTVQLLLNRGNAL